MTDPLDPRVAWGTLEVRGDAHGRVRIRVPARVDLLTGALRPLQPLAPDRYDLLDDTLGFRAEGSDVLVPVGSSAGLDPRDFSLALCVEPDGLPPLAAAWAAWRAQGLAARLPEAKAPLARKPRV